MTYDEIDSILMSSIGQHLQDALNLPVFFERQHLDSATKLNYLEVRLDDTIIDEISHETYVITVEVDIKVVRERDHNVLTIRKDTGVVAESLRQGIPLLTDLIRVNTSVVKADVYGTTEPIGGPYANSEVQVSSELQSTNLGCLSTQGFGGRRSSIDIRHYGQLDTSMEVIVATVSTKLSILL